jgi:hypothetical protein
MADHILLRPKSQLVRSPGAIAPVLLVTLAMACATAPAPSVVPTATPAPVPISHAPTDAEAMTAGLSPLVLQQEDLAAIGDTSDFQQFDEGRQLRTDLPGGSRSDPGRFGRVGGWKARYRRADPDATEGALIIESRVDLFTDAAGATADLEALAGDAPRTGARVAAPTRSVGEDAIGLVNEQEAVPSIAYYTVAWRRGPFLASVLVSGFKGEISLAETSTLADIVDRRLAAATGG